VAVASPQRGLETRQFVRFKTEEEDQMKRWTLSMMCVVMLLGIGLTASLVMAGEDERLSGLSIKFFNIEAHVFWAPMSISMYTN
jgi:hypothetical protein